MTFLTNLINVPIYALVLLAIVPTIATLVSLARHVFGFRSFSIYVPIITSIVFLELGLFYGIITSSIIFMATLLTHRFLKKFRMHYYVRVSFIYTVVCFLLFSLLLVLSAFSKDTPPDFRPLFPVILLVTLVESFFRTTVKEGEKRVTLMFLETVFISTISYLLISSTFFAKFITEHVWVLLFLFPLNAFLARYEGLRFSEFARFKNVILAEMSNLQEEEASLKKRKKKLKKSKIEAPVKENKKKVFFW